MAKVKKIRKWDEVTGNAVEEQIPESIDPIEDVGAGPSISRNHMRGIEDMVEQNDNNFDGVINNVKVEPADPDLEQSKGDRKSVLEKLSQQNKTALPVTQEKKVKKEGYFEREMV